MFFHLFRLFTRQHKFIYIHKDSKTNLAIQPKAIRLSLVFFRKGAASLAETFELSQTLALFGICLSPATVGHLHVWSAATFFTLTELRQPSAAVAQWIAMVQGFLAFKSIKIFPLGLGFNSCLLSVKEGVTVVRSLSSPGYGRLPRSLMLLNLGLVFLRVCQLLLSSQLRLVVFANSLPAWRLIFSAAAEQLWPDFTPQEISECDTSFFENPPSVSTEVFNQQ